MSSRMRVVLFSLGFAEYVYRYAAALADMCDVLLVLNKDNADRELVGQSLPRPEGLRVLYVNFNNKARVAWQVPSLLARIALFRPQILHFQEVPSVYNAAIIALFRGWIPLVLTVHDPAPHEGTDSTKAAKNARFVLSARRMVNGVVLHGRNCFNTYSALPEASGKRLFESRHGVILVGPQPAPPPEKNRVLFFGRMEQYKGLDTLVDAARILMRSAPEIKIHIVGRGPTLDQMLNEIALLPNLVCRRGFSSPEELIKEIQCASVVVLPYHSATQSGVVAAAFGNGRPVVATAVGGLSEAIEHDYDGLLVSARSVTGLVDALRRACDAQNNLILSKGARIKADTILSWSGIAEEVKTFYAALISQA